MSAPAGVPNDWDVDDVCTFLDSLNLGHTKEAFKTNAINGSDLLSLTDADMQDDLKLTGLQIKKIRGALQTIAPGYVPPASAPIVATTPPPPTPVVEASVPAANPIAPAVAKSNGAVPKISASDLDAYRSICTVIKDMEDQNLESRLLAAQQAANAAHAKLSSTAQTVASATKAKEDAEKEKEHREGWYVGKIIRGKERAEGKLGSAEAAIKDAEDRLAAANARIKEYTQQLEDSKATAHELQKQVYELKGHRAERDQLVARIFGAPDWGSEAMLSGLRATFGQMQNQMAENSGHAATYGRAGDLLKSASAKIARGLQALQGTQFMGGMEMGIGMVSPYRRPGGSILMDMAQMAAVRNANDQVKSAAADIMQARAILPTLPHMTEALIKDAQVGVFASFLLPGFGGDMLQMAMVRKSIRSVQQLAEETAECLNWCKSNMMQFSTVVNQLRSQIEAKGAEIEAYQNDQLQRALAGHK